MSQTQRISTNNTVVLEEGKLTTVILHKTKVVLVDYDIRSIMFNTGGWATATTVTRMNQAMNQFGLNWRVSRAGGKMTARNHVTGAERDFDGDILIVGF